MLAQIIGDELERLRDDEHLPMLTVTGVATDPDLRHATVYLASLPQDATIFLAECRIELQAAIAAQVRLKRTPLLRFEADPAVAAATRVEDVLRNLREGQN